MKFNRFRLLFFLSAIILLSSCLGTTTVTTTSIDPSFVSLVFKVNDSIPALSGAVFTLTDNTIVNLDSLPFKTRIDSVYPTYTFISTAGAKFYFPVSGYKYNKDSAVVTGTDTIDYRQPVRIRNWAADAKTYKDYYTQVNVHHVDPEKYIWSKVTDNLNSINASSQKTVILNDTLFYYLNDGTNAYLYTSLDGYNWNQSTVKGLPVNTPLTDMMQFNGKLYLTHDGSNIYTSADGFNWTKKSVNAYTFNSLLYVLNGQLWAVVQSNGSNYFAISNTGDFLDTDITTGTIPVNFPVSDFASVTYQSSTGKPKVLVSGGYSSTGERLKNSWGSEDGVYWVDFSNGSYSLNSHTLDTLAVGASIIAYDSKLFVFGMRTDNGGNLYKVSIDEGLSWQNPDTTHNFFPANYIPRSYQSAVVFMPSNLKGAQTIDKKAQILQSNRIFIVGGKAWETSFSDVWTGKLNRKSFLRQ
jgi:hypothetical protein